jgi:hypothetical protein
MREIKRNNLKISSAVKLLQLTVFVSSTFTSDLLIKVLSACLFATIEIKYLLFSKLIYKTLV